MIILQTILNNNTLIPDILWRIGSALFGLGEGPSTRAKVHAISVREAVALQRVWVPLRAGDGVDVQHVHGVDFLERTALGLDHEEVDDDSQGRTASSEHKTVEVVDIVGDHGAEERDQEVEQPVGSCREGHADSTVAGRVEFSDDGPHKRTPGGGEGSNEQTGEHNHNVTSLRSALRVGMIELVVADE